MKSEVKRICEASFLLALGVLLPLVFHEVVNAGSIFLPMHLPVIVCGFVCGPFFGALVGILAPLISALTTGMPSVPYLPGMMVELFVYGLSSGVFFRLIKTKHLVFDILTSLIISMVLGRLAGGLANLLIYASRGSQYTLALFLSGYFVTGWPGIAIQLFMIPSLLLALFKSHLLGMEDREFVPWISKKRNASEQAAFFDQLALDWDAHRSLSESVIADLLSKCRLERNAKVLDVACGSGVIDPELAKEGCQVLGLDISPKMIAIAIKKNQAENVAYAVSNFYVFKSPERFDAIIVFDAYPHFLDKEAFRDQAASLLRKGGRLFIIHSSSKETVNLHHSSKAVGKISMNLQDAKTEAGLFWTRFRVGVMEDDANHYFLELIKR
jgi:ubiquinone/menaquinone biosynthesis C-methylase UbiE